MDGVMRDRATLDFIRDRVLAEIRATPSVRPYLGDEEPRRRPGPKPRDVCQRGHREMVAVGGRRHCAACKRDLARRRRTEGVS